MQAQKKFRLLHEPALDGLRGIAVLAVIVFHAMPDQLPGGFIGVDIFFALSGYLITRLLILEFRSDRSISLVNFYWRRWWRLTPALMAMLLVYGVTRIWLGTGEDSLTQTKEVLWAASYTANWARAYQWHSMPDLGHAWSLAVEEQFYLLWPPVLIILMKIFGSGRRLLFAVIGLAFLSWAWRVYLQFEGASIERLYNGTDTRIETLLWGGVLAVVVHQGIALQSVHREWLKTAGWCTLMLMLMLLFSANWTDRWIYSSGITLVSGCSVVLIASLQGASTNGMKQFLRTWPMALIGKISYGLYLWHFPVERALLSFGLQGISLLFGTLGLTLVIASISYVWLESPCLKWRDQRSWG